MLWEKGGESDNDGVLHHMCFHLLQASLKWMILGIFDVSGEEKATLEESNSPRNVDHDKSLEDGELIW